MSEKEVLHADKSLIEHSSEIISEILHYGRTLHEPNSWLHESIGNHINHALKHLQDADVSAQEADFYHALCRVAMAVYLYDNERRSI